MSFKIEQVDSTREPFVKYTYEIYENGHLIAHYWHDHRGDEHGIEFVNGEHELWPVGRMTDFIEGGGPKPLTLSERAVTYLNQKPPVIFHPVVLEKKMNILRLKEKLTVVTEPVHVAAYDFNFELYFSCTHPSYFAEPEPCVLRVGAINSYTKKYEEMRTLGLKVVNSPEDHARASELTEWYPVISELTARTICQEGFPPVETVEAAFGWPVFVKGSRQTSKHNPELSIARSPSEYAEIEKRYRADHILHWQRVAVREFLHLQPVPGTVPGKVSPAFEFRTFWWLDVCVGFGQYWYQVPAYEAPDIAKGIEVAEEVARRLKVPFLVVDIAKTVEGRWVVIECNDGQEAGYAGAIPQVVWQNVLDQLSSV